MQRYTVTSRTLTIPVDSEIKVIPVFKDTGTAIKSTTFNISLEVTLLAAPVPQQITQRQIPFSITSTPIQINLTNKILSSSQFYVENSLESYFDENLELKSLVNFGNDRQVVLINKRYGPKDQTAVDTMQVKLLRPLPDDIGLGDTAFISREIGNTLIDNVKMRFAPELDKTPYLRPANTYVKVNKSLGKSLSNVTLSLLGLQTGSLGGYTTSNNISFEDIVMRQWYSFDFNSSELNIDFSNYENFVFYGSAVMRLEAFKQKLKKIEKLEIQRQQFSGSSFVGSMDSAATSYVLKTSAELAKEKENIIRSFDRYEQHLYFTPSGSLSPYSASVSYVDSETEYNSISYWPKDSNNNLYSTDNAIAESWYSTQFDIATRFDEQNYNNIVNSLPSHILEDLNSGAYITFVAMIGHFFDTIKPYIDQFPEIYDRNLNPNEGLSKDLIMDIADSIGFPLPTLNTVYNLSDSVIGSLNETPRRDYTVETYKRLLHNFPYFVKSKGTKTALNMLLRSLGISDSLIDVKEIGKSVTSSLYVFEEYSNGINFGGTSGKYIKIPVSESLRSPTSLQLSLYTVAAQDTTILRGNFGTSNDWALNLKQHPTNPTLGRFEIVDANDIPFLTSSYDTFYDGNLINLSLRTLSDEYDVRFEVYKTEDDDIIFSSSMDEASGSANFAPRWIDTSHIIIGSTGSFGYNTFDGIVDEIRLWGKNLSNEMTINTAFDPSSNAGDTYTDASNFLYVQLSFNKLNTGSLPTALENESPYASASVSPSLETIECNNIQSADFERYIRSVRQILPQIGSSGYVTKKIKIVEPASPVLDDDGVPTLSRTQSMVPVSQKQRNIQLGKSKVVVGTSPTEIINQNIIRNIGLENINAAIGTPTELYEPLGASLSDIQKHYSTYYRVDVDTNRYIRILSSVSSVLNEIVDYFIPARALLSTGIVIEPTIIERQRISPLRKMRVYGAGTRKTKNAPSSLTGSTPDYTATFNLSQTLDTKNIFSESGYFPTYTSSIEESIGLIKSAYPTYIGNPLSATPLESGMFALYDKQHLDWQLNAEYSGSSSLPWPKLTIDVGTSNLNKIAFNNLYYGQEGAEPFNRVYTRKLFSYEITASANNGLFIDALREIPPSCDFRDFGSYTFFNKESGVYYFPEIKYIPSINVLLNKTWNFASQSFDNETYWEYGQRYRKGDVVYQMVTQEEFSGVFTDEVIKSSRPGNKKYYVFTKDTEVMPPIFDIFWQSGSIPSYTPPSLDFDKWRAIKFEPVQAMIPKRVVYELFTVSDPSLNNFKTTAIDININLDIPKRTIDTFKLGFLLDSETKTGEIRTQNISLLLALQSTVKNVRFRLYRTEQDRNNDISRPIGIFPSGGSGLLLDTIITNENVVQLINPVASLVAGSNPPFGKLFYTIDNLEATPKSDVTVVLYYFGVEVDPIIPMGYLKKHYKFFRDNATATKRRNFLGCKNLLETTIDGLPVVEVFLTEGTEARVAPTKVKPNGVSKGKSGILKVDGLK
jgi:hypothetical protein